MKTIILLALVSLFIFNATCFGQTSATQTNAASKTDQFQYVDVSLINLIVNPDKYNGKHVSVVGYLNLEFEGDALYLHKEDYLASIAKNSVWVHINQFKLKQSGKCNKHYVIINAVFDAGDTGHMGMFGGALKDITRLDLWYQPGEKR
jgi:hypothetical protein